MFESPQLVKLVLLSADFMTWKNVGNHISRFKNLSSNDSSRRDPIP